MGKSTADSTVSKSEVSASSRGVSEWSQVAGPKRLLSMTLLGLFGMFLGVTSLLFITLRDPLLAEASSEFPDAGARELSLCSEFPRCFRLSGLIPQVLRVPVQSLLSQPSIATDTQQTFNEGNPWRIQFFQLVADYGFRFLCLGLVVLFIVRLVRPHLLVGLALASSFMLVSSGAVTLLGIDVLTHSLPGLFPGWRIDVWTAEATRFVLDYDYAAMAVITSMPIAIRRLGRNQSASDTSLAVGLTIVYSTIWEYTGALFAIALIAYGDTWRKASRVVLLACASFVVPAVLLLMSPSTGDSNTAVTDLLSTWAYYRTSNLLYWESLVEQAFMTIPVLLLFGFLVGVMFVLLHDPISLIPGSTRAVFVVYCVLLAGLVASFATSGLASEFTRQSLPLQVLTPLVAFLLVVEFVQRRQRHPAKSLPPTTTRNQPPCT